ncbi:sugar-binding transcriptional regulator [Cardiobacterium valvarum]|uniref:Putative deoxyribonucleoside regulator n=1 Tax=Cardiobacterium valvarum F0432 TaxID=797473 RepID=G9ZFP2_9GAMM|nr:sugar-binding transcriptional regulator [Cardiobacterium valvarum]EHM53795.1 putative deoxyribonucleoside regulator [Cardiobacterium valvarum F0432]
MDDSNKQGGLTRKDIQAIEAARLYYQHNKSQHDVAEALGISRPTVSKLLQHATAAGFVRITIHDPRDDQSTLAETLRACYGLSEVRVTPTPADGDIAALRRSIGSAGARLLEALVRDGDSIGVEWSNSIHAMAQALQPQLRRGIDIVQLRGSETKARQGLHEAETISLICRAFQASGQILPLPAVFDNLETKNLVERESNIRRVLERGRHCRIAVFTVGVPDQSSVLFASGFFSQDEIRQLLERSVGGICARFVDKNGRICLPDLNNRTVGISLPDLRHKEQRLLIAGGESKVRAIHVALRYGYANHLVTDTVAARLLLALANGAM